MSLEVLQQLGLSLNEARIYEALLDLKEAGVSDISSSAKVHRRNVYDTLNRLIDKGLAFPILSKGENLYSPVDPNKLLELIKEKEKSLEDILPDLNERYEKTLGSQEAYIYRGIEGFKNYMRDILRIEKEVYLIGAKLGWFDSRLKTFLEQFLKEAKRKNIKFRHIFDYEVKEKGLEDIKNFDKSSYRFFSKEYKTNSAIDIFGDYVVTFTGLKFKRIDDDVTLFILKDKKLADSYRIWFEFMFKACR
jgi:sugar-specific transcriptional regulator TrmB